MDDAGNERNASEDDEDAYESLASGEDADNEGENKVCNPFILKRRPRGSSTRDQQQASKISPSDFIVMLLSYYSRLSFVSYQYVNVLFYFCQPF